MYLLLLCIIFLLICIDTVLGKLVKLTFEEENEKMKKILLFIDYLLFNSELNLLNITFVLLILFINNF